jgi:hypothetical protein
MRCPARLITDFGPTQGLHPTICQWLNQIAFVGVTSLTVIEAAQGQSNGDSHDDSLLFIFIGASVVDQATAWSPMI